MDDTEKIILLILMLRKDAEKREIICAARSKPRFWVRDISVRRKQHGEFYRLVQELTLKRKEL